MPKHDIIAESVCKCDRRDAKVLNELARSNLKLPVCYMPDDEEFALREHLRARSDLVRMRTMLKNRVHAVLHRRGIPAPTADLFTKAGRAFLGQQELDEAGRTILDRYLETMDQIHRAVDESTASLKELMRRPRWSRPAAVLMTMPGIGLITALTILAELGNLKRFRSRAVVANYAGLVPVVRDSNQKHYSGGISHRSSKPLAGGVGRGGLDGRSARAGVWSPVQTCGTEKEQGHRYSSRGQADVGGCVYLVEERRSVPFRRGVGG